MPLPSLIHRAGRFVGVAVGDLDDRVAGEAVAAGEVAAHLLGGGIVAIAADEQGAVGRVVIDAEISAVAAGDRRHRLADARIAVIDDLEHPLGARDRLFNDRHLVAAGADVDLDDVDLVAGRIELDRAGAVRVREIDALGLSAAHGVGDGRAADGGEGG